MAVFGGKYRISWSWVNQQTSPFRSFQKLALSLSKGAALVQVVVDAPLNGTVELAGPEPIRLDELVRRFLSATQDPRKVTTDVQALYFGIELNDQSLTPGDNPRIGPTRFEDWLSRSRPHV